MLLRPKPVEAPRPKARPTMVGRGAARVAKLAQTVKTRMVQALNDEMGEGNVLSTALECADAVVTTIVKNIGEAHDAVADLVERREAARPRSRGPHRASNGSVRALLILTMLAGGGMKAADDMQAVDQPHQLVSGTYLPVGTHQDGLPSPEDDIDDIMVRLHTPQMVEKFLAKHVSYQYVSFPRGFVDTFRRSPKNFLKNKKGPCNNYGEFVAEWAAAYGIRSYILVTRPSVDRLLTEQWHQVNVLCIERGKLYFIFDNGALHEHHGSLEEFRQRHYPTMTTYHCVEWHRCKETFLGGMTMHGRGNVEEDEMIEYPELDIHVQRDRNPSAENGNFDLPEAEKSHYAPRALAEAKMIP